jgi:hypothetical protein
MIDRWPCSARLPLPFLGRYVFSELARRSLSLVAPLCVSLSAASSPATRHPPPGSVPLDRFVNYHCGFAVHSQVIAPMLAPNKDSETHRGTPTTKAPIIVSETGPCSLSQPARPSGKHSLFPQHPDRADRHQAKSEQGCPATRWPRTPAAKGRTASAKRLSRGVGTPRKQSPRHAEIAPRSPGVGPNRLGHVPRLESPRAAPRSLLHLLATPRIDPARILRKRRPGV